MNPQDAAEVSTPISGSEHLAPSPKPSNDITLSAQEPSIIPVTEGEIHTDTHQPRQRASLTESERLLLVRLCCSRGEEYLQGKERFWIRQTEEFNRTSGKSIANARTIVMRMLKQYKTKCSKDTQASGTVFAETELDQALNGWNAWVVRAEREKAAKRLAEEEEKAE
ncbi:hypothetical protein B9Z19DRAFT_1092089 [Tuber borchii]|uniref:Uncharacterized protein n=1 Tax=Tuber borchii TaxID=42251 RepID=A0A2T6ZGV2_TUBBO|nr:hypothetical protein B9Z19DRAFT_1092089 [Tuber borchii]